MNENFSYKENYRDGDTDELKARVADNGGAFISITSIEHINEVESSTDILSIHIPHERIADLIKVLERAQAK